jgi:acyl-CoA thioesterase-1
MKKILITALLFFITLPVLAENTILIIGDSISAGYGINPEQGWVALLQNRLHVKHFNYKVINASISGDTTSDGLQRLPAELKQYHPQITVLELGGNDGLRGLPLYVIKNNLIQMIRLSLDANSKVMVLGVRMPPNYGLQYTRQFQQIYDDFSRRKDIAVVPSFLKGIDNTPALMQVDGIHPVTAAQTKILDNVWPALETLLHK